MMLKTHAILILCLWVVVTAGAGAQPPPGAETDEQILRNAGISVAGQDLLDYLRQRTAGASPDELQTLVRQLGADSFKVRSQASSALVRRGGPAVPYLRQALTNRDPEVQRRARACLREIGERADSQ